MNTKVLASLLGLALALSLFTGCETAPAQAPLQALRTNATFSAPKDRVWPLLVAEVGLAYPMRAIEKDSGLISTDWVTLPAGFNNMNAGNWIIKPGGFLATWAGLRMNMKIMAVETEPGTTKVTINCHFEAFEDNVQKSWIVARTNGSVEDAILTNVERQLASAPAGPSPQAPAIVQTKTAGDALLELKALLDAGAITKDEYDAKKKAALERL